MNQKTPLQKLAEKYNPYPVFEDADLTDPNQRGLSGDTLLHLVALLGTAEEIDALIASAAYINAIGGMGQTPLHYAAMNGQGEVVKKLLVLGADFTIRNEFGKIPADTAVTYGFAEIAQILREAAGLPAFNANRPKYE